MDDDGVDVERRRCWSEEREPDVCCLGADREGALRGDGDFPGWRGELCLGAARHVP